MGVTSIEYHEGALACQAVDVVVVSELSEWEPVAPVGLSVVNKDAKILFDFLVNVLGLSIGLWVKHC